MAHYIIYPRQDSGSVTPPLPLTLKRIKASEAFVIHKDSLVFIAWDDDIDFVYAINPGVKLETVTKRMAKADE